MRFCVLRSGSSGNCTFLEHGDSRLLIDAGGLSHKRLVAVLTELGIEPSTLSAILVTHLHSDHICAPALRFARTCGVPIWIHANNSDAWANIFESNLRTGISVHTFSSQTAFDLGTLRIKPFKLPHDADNTTVGFRICPTDVPLCTLTYASDLGKVTPTALKHMLDVQAIVLEANHDITMLWDNPFRPDSHKRRVAGDHGHLSNHQCADTLVEIFKQSRHPPSHIVLGHLSKDNNSARLAIETVTESLHKHGFHATLTTAFRDRCTPFIDLDKKF